VAIYEAGKAAWQVVTVDGGGALCKEGVVKADRFWHTMTVNTGTAQASVVNEVACNPVKTTGTRALYYIVIAALWFFQR